MSVANSHQVRNRAIASAALDIGVKNVFILFLIKYRLGHRLLASRGRDLRGDGGRLAFKEIFNLVLVCLQYLLNSVWLFDELKHPVLFAECKHLVGSELEIKVHLFQQVVHQRYYLKHKLILAHVVPMFVNHAVYCWCLSCTTFQLVVRARGGVEVKLEWAHGWLEDCAAFGFDTSNVKIWVDWHWTRRVQFSHVKWSFCVHESP